jgi:UDP-N-acetylglucosamine 2-epimerase (non-hydrolysing)
MPYSDLAREYLLREGIAPDRIIKTGSPMYEVLNFYQEKICASAVLDRFGLQENAYFIASCHREENVDSPANLKNLVDSINTLVNTYSYPLIMSTHPRTRRRLESSGLKLEQGITISKPLGFFDYVHLQQHSALVLSDSGTINEESSILNFPALNIREAHERPEGMEEAAVIMSGLKPDRVLEAARIALLQKRGDERQFRLVADYAMPNVSQKVLRILLSYIDYVNLVVWKKS